MDDRDIIALYWQRAERAIHETAAKYGGLCYTIAHNILSSREDSEECVNDTYLGLWNAIPPQKPERFSAFVARVTRNLALKRFDHVNAQKRNPVAVRSLEELGECVSGRESVETEVEAPAAEGTAGRVPVGAGRGAAEHIPSAILVFPVHRRHLPPHWLQPEQDQIHVVSDAKEAAGISGKGGRGAMTAKELAENIGNINQRLVESAERTPNYGRRKRKSRLRRTLALAAAAVLMTASFAAGALSGGRGPETIPIPETGLTVVLPESWRGKCGL